MEAVRESQQTMTLYLSLLAGYSNIAEGAVAATLASLEAAKAHEEAIEDVVESVEGLIEGEEEEETGPLTLV